MISRSLYDHKITHKGKVTLAKFHRQKDKPILLSIVQHEAQVTFKPSSILLVKGANLCAKK